MRTNTIERLHSLRRLSICLALAFVSVSIVDAQSRVLSSADRRLDEFNKQAAKVARDELDREKAGKRPTAEERRLAEAKTAQIKKDFEEMQTAYNLIVTKLQAKEEITPTFVSDITATISKSAAHLRANLNLPPKPETGPTEEKSAPPASMKTLCFQLYEFLTNPIFENPGVLDLASAGKARDSLDQLLQTSETVRHSFTKVD